MLESQDWRSASNWDSKAAWRVAGHCFLSYQ